MKTESTNLARWWMVVLYAVAMAWVEAAVVFYLRTMMYRIVPYQPDPLPVMGGLASVELPREFATLVMLFAVGWLAGRTWRRRFAYMAIAFGVWDIFYYVFLKVICGWPYSLLNWDVLFLLPVPWWGPVLAPVLISLLMIVWGTLVTQFPFAAVAGPSRRLVWILNCLGVVLALGLFMEDALAAAPRGSNAIRTVLPGSFNWPLFGLALALMSAPLIRTCRHLSLRRSVAFGCAETDPDNSCDMA